MFNNKLPISSLIGIVMISISSFFLFTFGATVYNLYLRLEFRFVFLGLGIFFFLLGLGMFLKKKWIRPILTINIFAFGILMFASTFGDGPFGYLDIFQKIAIMLPSIGVTLFLLLLLYNQKVSEEFGVKTQETETEDILDMI